VYGRAGAATRHANKRLESGRCARSAAPVCRDTGRPNALPVWEPVINMPNQLLLLLLPQCVAIKADPKALPVWEPGNNRRAVVARTMTGTLPSSSGDEIDLVLGLLSVSAACRGGGGG
jgi:hypothetical protein